MADSPLSISPSRNATDTESERRNKAIALVRALGTVAEGNRQYISFASSTVLSHKSIAHLAAALAPDGLRPLTDRGRSELERAASAVAQALDCSKPFREALSAVELSCESIDAMSATSHEAIAHLDGPMPDILGASEAEAFASFVMSRMSATCYFTSLLYGSHHLAAFRHLLLSKNDMRLSYSLCLEALENLRRSLSSAVPYGSWRVDPIVHPGCAGVPARNGYVFRWSSEAEYIQALRIGELKELNPGLAVGSTGGRHRFMGMGYIVGPAPNQAYGLREQGVHVSLPVHAFGIHVKDIGNPLAIISAYFHHDDVFCIDPQEFAAALDRHVRCSMSRSS